MLRRAFSTLAQAALLPVRGAELLYRAGRAHQHFFQPVLNGALGDQLAARHDPRAIAFSFRRGGLDVPVAELHLSETKQKTVVFLHGLMGDELIWQTGFPDSPAGPLRYGPRLAAEAGCRPLYLRYNSGLHISENGRALSRLLTELVETYPDAIGELILVGHSMGGLLIRSAGYYAAKGEVVLGDEVKGDEVKGEGVLGEEVKGEEVKGEGALGEEVKGEGVRTGEKTASKNYPPATSSPTHHSLHHLSPHHSTSPHHPEAAPWLAHLRSVFLLGVPHEGSYLEQNGLLVERLLRRINLFPTRFLSDAIARRSNGIKDLGQALLVDEDWQQPDDPALPRPRTTVPLLPGVRYHVLVGDWLRAGRLQALRDYFGDGLVSAASGRGQLFSDETELPPGASVRTARFGQQHHGGLLYNAGVYQYLRQWV